LGVAIIQPDAGFKYYNRSSADAQAVASTGGEAVTVHYTFTSSGTYAIVVWKEDSLYSSEFNLRGCQDIYLPVVERN
jgi:hypothetical protein